MPNTHIRAIYQRGAFRPLEDVGGYFVEGQKVELVIHNSTHEVAPNDLPLSDEAQQTLAIFKNFYAGLSDQEIEEIEQHLRQRLNFSRKVDLAASDQK
jgi:predicted DNA-binding antitoxin AbrB/MazE fold protein